MTTDIITVARKELREMLIIGDPRGRSKFSLLIVIAVFGIFIPLQNGRDWITSPISIAVWAWMPFLWVSSIVADSFAGERERHTLESLLATRLSDRAILFGKLLAALVYGFLMTWTILLASLVTVNLAFRGQGLILFPSEVMLGAFVFSILISGLSASIGVLVSLRAGSVRQAQQWMSAGMLLIFLPFMLVRYVPQKWLMAAENMLVGADPLSIGMGLAGILLVIEVILIAIATRLFQRSKLVLD
jgi:ABC-2 type transport system permease protein